MSTRRVLEHRFGFTTEWAMLMCLGIMIDQLQKQEVRLLSPSK
jgi:hypothetical protein